MAAPVPAAGAAPPPHGALGALARLSASIGGALGVSPQSVSSTLTCVVGWKRG
jgi:hypothetical protein